MTIVRETGFFYVSLGNLKSNVQRIKGDTLLGTAAPVVLVHKAIPQVALEHQTETKKLLQIVFIKFMKK